MTLWHMFSCPECGVTWGSQQSVPDREWCACGTVETPEYTGEEELSE